MSVRTPAKPAPTTMASKSVALSVLSVSVVCVDIRLLLGVRGRPAGATKDWIRATVQHGRSAFQLGLRPHPPRVRSTDRDFARLQRLPCVFTPVECCHSKHRVDSSVNLSRRLSSQSPADGRSNTLGQVRPRRSQSATSPRAMTRGTDEPSGVPSATSTSGGAHSCTSSEPPPTIAAWVRPGATVSAVATALLAELAAGGRHLPSPSAHRYRPSATPLDSNGSPPRYDVPARADPARQTTGDHSAPPKSRREAVPGPRQVLIGSVGPEVSQSRLRSPQGAAPLVVQMRLRWARPTHDSFHARTANLNLREGKSALMR